MGRLIRRSVILPVLLLCLPASAAQNGKKLIEWGWDQTNTAFMRQHAAEMDASPFDGTIFSINMNDGNSFADAYWGAVNLTVAGLSKSVADLQATHFTNLTDNFLRLNVTPYGPSGGIDWFDNGTFTSIINNSQAAAQAAKDGGAKGIMLDIEQYTQQIWQYSAQRNAGTKSWSQYAAEVRLRGNQIMTAFQQGFPDLTLFTSFGYSLPGAQSGNNPANLAAASYGLLAPFMDGLFDAATGGTTIVDGYELSYPISVRRHGVSTIDAAMNTQKTGVLPIVAADHTKYADHLSASFATWMDFPAPAWNPDNPSSNYNTPSDIEETLKASLARVDEYAWLYTEKPRWWTPAGGTQSLSPAYIAAVQNAVPEPSSISMDATFDPGALPSDFGWNPGGSVLPSGNVAGGVWSNNPMAEQTSYWSGGAAAAGTVKGPIIHGWSEIQVVNFDSGTNDDKTVFGLFRHTELVGAGNEHGFLSYFSNGEYRAYSNGFAPNIPVANTDGAFHKYGWQVDESSRNLKLFLDEWTTRAMRWRLGPLKKLARTLRGHRPLILNWFHAKGEISAGAAFPNQNSPANSAEEAYLYCTETST